MSDVKTTTETREIGMPKIIAVFAFVFISLLAGINIFGTSPHMPLLFSAAFAAIIAVTSGYKWSELEETIADNIKAGAPAIIVMLIIGMVIGTWMIAGIVPTMIYYGLQILSPTFFLASACLICAVVSVMTGSSWSTVGTMGVAFMGIGAGLGISAGMTAGAIISGAYFGDKMSPLSDTTNLAPAMAGTDVFTHIKHMVFTTGPSFVLALIGYTVLGMGMGDKAIDASTVELYAGTLSEYFNISPMLLIPPLCVLLMLMLKVPAIPGLLGVAVLGCIFGAIFQGNGISILMSASFNGVSMDTGIDVVNSLVNRGGIMSMMGTIALILIALCFAGIVEKTGMVSSIIRKILTRVKSDKGLLTATIFTTLFSNFATGVQYVALILPGRMFKDIYAERKLHPKNLSRILEDVGTLCAPFCPWSTDAAFLLGTLGVTVGAYAPFMFLAILNPIVSLICAWTGWTIEKLDEPQSV